MTIRLGALIFLSALAYSLGQTETPLVNATVTTGGGGTTVGGTTTGTVSTTNQTTITVTLPIFTSNITTQKEADENDIKALNLLLALERVKLALYDAGFANNFTAASFNESGLPAGAFNATVRIRNNAAAHVAFLEALIKQLNGTAVPACKYSFKDIGTVKDFLALADTIENRGAYIFNGIQFALSNAGVRQVVSTMGSIEARQGAYLNILTDKKAFTDTGFDNATSPADGLTWINNYQTCNFTFSLPQAAILVLAAPATTVHVTGVEVTGVTGLTGIDVTGVTGGSAQLTGVVATRTNTGVLSATTRGPKISISVGKQDKDNVANSAAGMLASAGMLALGYFVAF